MGFTLENVYIIPLKLKRFSCNWKYEFLNVIRGKIIWNICQQKKLREK